MKINRHLPKLLLVLLFFYLFVLQVYAIWPFTIDDMYIPLRYAKNWVAGYGLVWNVGEPPVEGYSNFSFLLLARIALFLGYDPVMVLKGAGVIGLFCTCIAVYALARMWFLTTIAIIPCLLLLAYKGQIGWSVSGLETTIYEALICFSVFFIFRGLGYSLYPQSKENLRTSCFIVAGILLAFAGMTRPEAPALMLLFVILLFLSCPSSSTPQYRQCLVIFCCTIFFCFAPYFIWRWHYYGRLFPNPVYCKGLSRSLLFTLDKNYLRLIWPFALLALPALWKSKDNRHYYLWLPSVLYLILLIDAEPIVAFDNRLFLPAFALLLPLAIQGMSSVLKQYFPKQDEIYNAVMYLGVFLLMFFCIPMLTITGYRHFSERPLAGERIRQQVVTWLGHHTSVDSRVVLADSGLIPYLSQNRFIDSYCLNNAEMTKVSTVVMYQRLCESVLESTPDVIILTALIDEGKTIYTPADACLAVKLARSNKYCLHKSIETGDGHSYYRYEIFSKFDESCSKMHRGI